MVLICIRELLGWMQSLSQHAYEIFSAHGLKRKANHYDWMLKDVEMKISSLGFDALKDSLFTSVPALWRTYASGYLESQISVGGATSRVAIVRHEDLISCPEKVVTELQTIDCSS